MTNATARDALSLAQSGSSTPADLAAAQVFATLALVDAVREVGASLDLVNERLGELKELGRIADRLDDVQGWLRDVAKG